MIRRALETKIPDHYRMKDNPDCEDFDPFKADFRNFLYYVFTEVLRLGPPHPIQYDIADWYQNIPVGQDGIARGQVQAMRGCGKTVIAACFICWLWYLNPRLRLMFISSNGKRAEEFSGLVKQIIDGSELLRHLAPSPMGQGMFRGKKRKLKQEQNTLCAFDIANAGPGKDPSFSAYGVFGGFTGTHPDVIIPDDIEIPENSLTALKRERLFNKMREFESLVMEFGMILQQGTPQTEESVYVKSKEAGYPIRRWPAQLPNPAEEETCEDVSPWIMKRLREGEAPDDPTYPERFPSERLMEKRAKGEAYYRLQFLLDTSLADLDRYPLKKKDLMVLDQDQVYGPTNTIWGSANRLDIDAPGFKGDYFVAPAYVEPEHDKWQDAVLYIDPKGGGADTVGYAVAKFLRGMIYVPEVGGLAAGKMGTSEAVMVKLAKVAFEWGVKKVYVESNWGGSREDSAYARLLSPHMAKWNGPTHIETVWNSGQKEVRMLDDLEPMMNAHKIVISHQAAKCQDLIYQMTHLSRAKGSLIHDDVIEAFWGAVSRFRSLCIINPEEAAAKQDEQEAVQAAKEFDKASPYGWGSKKEEGWSEKKRRRAGSLSRGGRPRL